MTGPSSAGLRLRFLGSGDAFGSGGRFQTCLCLEGPHGSRALIDCGATSLVALKRAGVDPGSIGASSSHTSTGTTSAGSPSSSWTVSSRGGRHP